MTKCCKSKPKRARHNLSELELKRIGWEWNGMTYSVLYLSYKTVLGQDTMRKVESMTLSDIRHEYKRLVKMSGLNDELIYEISERLAKQDRIAEVEMTTSEAVQTDNDIWTKRLKEVTRRYRNYQDEASRLKNEHLSQETGAQMLEEKNESFKPDIRNLVDEIDELKQRRQVCEEIFGQGIDAVTEKAEKLVLDNEKNYEKLERLKSELNTLKIGLLEDEEPDVPEVEESTDDSAFNDFDTGRNKLSPHLLADKFDIDLIGHSDPVIYTPRPSEDGKAQPCESDDINTYAIHDADNGDATVKVTKIRKNERPLTNEANTIGKSESLHQTILKRSEISNVDKRAQYLTPISEPCKREKRWVVSNAGVNKNHLGTDLYVGMPQEIPNPSKTKSEDAILKIDKKQQMRRKMLDRDRPCKAVSSSRSDRRISAVEETVPINTEADKHTPHFVNRRTVRTKVEKRTPNACYNIDSNKEVIATSEPAKTFAEKAPIPSIVPVVSKKILKETACSKSKRTNSKSNHLVNISALGGNASIPHSGAHDANNTELKQAINKRLPPINPANTLPKQRKKLKMKAVSLEEALPSISSTKKKQENGVVCSLPISSPRPLYTNKSFSPYYDNKIHNSISKIDKISPSEAKAIEIGKVRTENNIKLVGDRKLLNRRESLS